MRERDDVPGLSSMRKGRRSGPGGRCERERDDVPGLSSMRKGRRSGPGGRCEGEG